MLRRGGRLVRHYFLVSLFVTGAGLLTSAVLETYFRYRENVGQLARLQREITAAAAFKIEAFVEDVEGAMRAATKSREIARTGLSPEYRFELEKLLLVARPISQAVAFDANGVEQARAHRFPTVVLQTDGLPSATAAFEEARRGRTYFGPVYFVRGSEPHMTMAVPIERFAGDLVGVLRAEVNLKYVWEVVSGIRVGKAGYAYAVSRSGALIAHPDLSLVLQRRNMGHLELVKAAFQARPGLARPEGTVTHDLQGKRVVASSAVIQSPGWAVFVQQPMADVYGPVYASVVRTSALLLVGLGIALLAGLFIAHRVVRPLETLRQGVERIGRGDLTARLDLKTGNEIEILAEEFNKMAAKLQEAYTGLERKVAERTSSLVVVNQRLEEASRYKSQFLAILSHELRTPLNAVIGFTRLVLRKTEGRIPALQRENLQKVLISAEQLLILINGLLDLAKIEAGKMEVVTERFRVQEVLDLAVATVEPMLKGDNVGLVREIGPDIGPMSTDPEKLKQVLVNLLSNAAKFTEQGEVKVSAWQEQGFLKVVVADTGIGMDRESLEHIFEEFHQADMSSARKYGGSGLGLAIVKKLVNLLGGEISVQSEVGKGSTFAVTLPMSLKRGAATG